MIMAGGEGTRLWPMSRSGRPKQLLPLIGGRSLLEIAADRLAGLVPPGRRYICTAEQYRDAVRGVMPDIDDANILGEPAACNTANAVGFTAAVLAKHDPDAVFAVLTADHLIEPADAFAIAMDRGFALVEADRSRFVTFSIPPTFAAEGYGYVERGEAISDVDDAYRARRFVEKPSRERAEQFLAAGTFGWNSGMFVFSATSYLDALRRFMPDAHAGLMEIQAAWGTPQQMDVLNRVYPGLPNESVDKGVMEPISKAAADDAAGCPFAICTVKMHVSWMDVGSWSSYAKTLDADADGNRTNAQALHHKSHNVTAIADDPDHMIATIGCANLIIVRTADATLICHADRAEDVRAIAERVSADLR